MDALTIDLLASLDPSSPLPCSKSDSSLPDNDCPLHEAERDRFLAKYMMTNFGHYIAQKFANHGTSFPIPMIGRDQWVFKAYLMRLDPYTNFDKHIAEAFHLSNYVAGDPALGRHLKAMLLSFGPGSTATAHIHAVSLKTGVSFDTLDAFELLFYNVIDRQEDALYMATEAYPDTRMVEFDADYLKNSAHSDLIRRVGYNHKDLDLTAYLAGIGDHSYLREISASDNREADLTRYLMGNGLIMAHSNLLNQRSIGMNRVSNLLAATRHSGQTLEEPALGSVAPLYSAAFAKAVDYNREEVIEHMRVEEAQSPANNTDDVVLDI